VQAHAHENTQNIHTNIHGGSKQTASCGPFPKQLRRMSCNKHI
jgi:hypothetical protein